MSVSIQGRAIPGEEARTDTLDHDLLVQTVEHALHPGTFNIQLLQEPQLALPVHGTSEYKLWPCHVRSLEGSSQGWFNAYILEVKGEDLPKSYVELMSEHFLREKMKMLNFPSFICEVML